MQLRRVDALEAELDAAVRRDADAVPFRSDRKSSGRSATKRTESPSGSLPTITKVPVISRW